MDQIAAPIPGADGTILVADGEVLVRMAIAQYLRDCGYRVFEVGSGEEATIVLSAQTITVDIVLCDAALPGGTGGFALARWLRASRPDVRIILVGTPEGAADAAADLCDDGPNLAKPYEPQLVADRIRRMLAGRPRPSATIAGGAGVRA